MLSRQQRRHTILAANLSLNTSNMQAQSTGVAQGVDMQQGRQYPQWQVELGLQATADLQHELYCRTHLIGHSMRLLSRYIAALATHQYKVLQVVTVAISTLGASVLFYKSRNPYFLAGAALTAAIASYTSLLLYPINHQLLNIRNHGREDPAVEEMPVRWSTIQSGRMLLSCSAMVTILYGALQGHKLTLW
ncbi:hypothetical protein BGZ99_008470 [Dissophora globulifera]|uniref:Uncharacterized protein n=1 Tax=Dissophora globulifera TaxID=979702 RepID=A0A9P6RAW9_9FUNG|nr:hypothetical protein BGZ99_008470 [Dissophora globulifera]